MNPDDAARALLSELNLPSGAANVLVWYAGEQPSLRIWVDERHYWATKKTAPASFNGFSVEVEKRPIISAQ